MAWLRREDSAHRQTPGITVVNTPSGCSGQRFPSLPATSMTAQQARTYSPALQNQFLEEITQVPQSGRPTMSNWKMTRFSSGLMCLAGPNRRLEMSGTTRRRGNGDLKRKKK